MRSSDLPWPSGSDATSERATTSLKKSPETNGAGTPSSSSRPVVTNRAARAMSQHGASATTIEMRSASELSADGEEREAGSSRDAGQGDPRAGGVPALEDRVHRGRDLPRALRGDLPRAQAVGLGNHREVTRRRQRVGDPLERRMRATAPRHAGQEHDRRPRPGAARGPGDGCRQAADRGLLHAAAGR